MRTGAGTVDQEGTSADTGEDQLLPEAVTAAR